MEALVGEKVALDVPRILHTHGSIISVGLLTLAYPQTDHYALYHHYCVFERF